MHKMIENNGAEPYTASVSTDYSYYLNHIRVSHGTGYPGSEAEYSVEEAKGLIKALQKAVKELTNG